MHQGTHAAHHALLIGVEDEGLILGDDALDVLQVDDQRPVAAEQRARVAGVQLRVQQAQVAQLHAQLLRDGVLVRVHDRRLAVLREAHPLAQPDRGRHLLVEGRLQRRMAAHVRACSTGRMPASAAMCQAGASTQACMRPAPEAAFRMPDTGLGGALSLLLSALAILASIDSLGTRCAAAIALWLLSCCC
jgi:hypothetical protein